MPYEISLSNQQSKHAVDEPLLVESATAVLRDSEFSSAMISLAVVDDATMQDINRRFLNHDWPTDVLSFVLQDDGSHLEGEVIISADTAVAMATELGCSANAEQLLYIVHGMLHLVGYRDKALADAHEMQAAEARYLRQFGYEPTDRADGSEGRSAEIGVRKMPNGATTP